MDDDSPGDAIDLRQVRTPSGRLRTVPTDERRYVTRAELAIWVLVVALVASLVVSWATLRHHEADGSQSLKSMVESLSQLQEDVEDLAQRRCFGVPPGP